MHSEIELLAPAGSPEAGYAALQHGADAIYLGLRNFSARASAVNFSLDELAAIVNYAHGMERSRRVYVTINTLVQERRLAKLLDVLEGVSDAGADAIIVQDLGVCRLARRHFPELDLHASTQMSIHNEAGARQLKELGINRVVTARELSLNEIDTICQIPDLEVEVFIHGALCYAYSGLCLLSSHLRGLSGNRGKCMYICRDAFRAEGGNPTRPLSMKDLALPGQLELIREAGVRSLKIEGRKKTPLYVAASTAYYRRLLDGPISDEERHEMESDLRTIYSRPQTTFHLTSRDENLIEPVIIGHQGEEVGEITLFSRGRHGALDRVQFKLKNRTLERHDGLLIHLGDDSYGFGASRIQVAKDGRLRDVTSADPGDVIEVELPPDHKRVAPGNKVYCSMSMKVRRSFNWEIPRQETLMARHKTMVEVIVEPKRITARTHTDIASKQVVSEYVLDVERSLKHSKNPEAARNSALRSFEKTGGTSLQVERVHFLNPDNLHAAASTFNLVRRELFAKAEKDIFDARKDRVQQLASELPEPVSTALPESWSIKVDNRDYLGLMDNDLEAVSDIVLPLEAAQSIADLPLDKLRIALPTVSRQRDEELLQDSIARLIAAGVRKWEAGNLSARTYLGQWWNELDVSAGWQLHSLNSAAIDEVLSQGFSGFTLSPEDDAGNLTTLAGIAGESGTLIVYQDTELCISEACLESTTTGCCSRNCDARQTSIESKHGDQLLAINKDCRTVLISRAPFCLSGNLDKLKDAGIARFRAEFVNRKYTADEVKHIWDAVRHNRPIKSSHIGNYVRKLQ